MDFIIQIFWINFILFLWFETDGFIEYAKLFRLNNLFKINDFLEYKEEKCFRIVSIRRKPTLDLMKSSDINILDGNDDETLSTDLMIRT